MTICSVANQIHVVAAWQGVEPTLNEFKWYWAVFIYCYISWNTRDVTLNLPQKVRGGICEITGSDAQLWHSNPALHEVCTPQLHQN